MPGEPTAAYLAASSAKTLLCVQQEQMLKTIFTPAQIKQMDKWIKGQNDPAIDRSEAIRRLVELGLKVRK
jgi:hypothetical protein